MPIIQLFLQTKNATNQATFITNNITEMNTTDSNGLHVRKSEVTIIPKRDQIYKIFCAGNIDGQQPVKSNIVEIDVLYQADQPYVSELGRKFPWLENQTRNLSCITSNYSNPPSQVIWSSHRGTNGTDLIIARLTPNDNGKLVSCQLVNKYTVDKNITVKSPPVTLNIDYAPEINVTIIGSAQLNMTSNITCEASGFPTKYTFHPWKHMLGEVTIRSHLQSNYEGIINSSKNILTLNRLSLQDMGTYVCSVDNGIRGVNGDVIQTSTAVLNVKGMPEVVNRKNDKFAGDTGSSVSIYVAFYSDPVITDLKFQRNGSNVKNTSRTIMNLRTNDVELLFHNTKVKLAVWMAHLLIQNLTADDFDDYNLVLENSLGKTDFKLQLKSSGPPFMVDTFYYNRFIEGGNELHFHPGFNGGRKQTFVIQYRSVTSRVWKNTSITYLREEQTEYQLPNGTYFVNVAKPPPGDYMFRMFSMNNIGKSPYSRGISVVILPEIIGTGDEKNQCNQLILSVVVAMGTAIVALIVAVIALVIVILRKRSILHKPQSGNTLEESEVPGYEVGGGVVPTGVHNAVSNEYEGLSNVRDREDPYQEMQGIWSEERKELVLDEDHEIELSTNNLKEHGSSLRSKLERPIPQVSGYSTTCSEYENPVGSKVEVHSCMEPLDGAIYYENTHINT